LSSRDILQVEIGDFAGPLDLLCHLVENRQIQASSIRVSDLIDIYARYLVEIKDVPLGKVAQIFILVSKILLMKIRALFPDKKTQEETTEQEEKLEDIELDDVLRQYKPYRLAARYLWELKEIEDRCYGRPFFDKPLNDDPMIYLVGDLYALSVLWFRLYRDRISRQRQKDKNVILSAPIVFETVPEEVQVERKIKELKEILKVRHKTELGELVEKSKGKAEVIITLLALLEMCRLGLIKISQERHFDTLIIWREPGAFHCGPID